jgi:anti-anti-sigma factor
MKLDLREEGDVSILVLSGQLTIGAEGQLREAIDTLLESNRSNILLDFSQVDFMDSVGIGELVANYRTVKRLGGALKIFGPTKRVWDSLSLTRLLPILSVFEDMQVALDSFTTAEEPDA